MGFAATCRYLHDSFRQWGLKGVESCIWNRVHAVVGFRYGSIPRQPRESRAKERVKSRRDFRVARSAVLLHPPGNKDERSALGPDPLEG